LSKVKDAVDTHVYIYIYHQEKHKFEGEVKVMMELGSVQRMHVLVLTTNVGIILIVSALRMKDHYLLESIIMETCFSIMTTLTLMVRLSHSE